MNTREYLIKTFGRLFEIPEEAQGPKRYGIIRRNVTILMLLVTLIPLVLMALINYHQYQSALKDEDHDASEGLDKQDQALFRAFPHQQAGHG